MAQEVQWSKIIKIKQKLINTYRTSFLQSFKCLLLLFFRESVYKFSTLVIFHHVELEIFWIIKVAFECLFGFSVNIIKLCLKFGLFILFRLFFDLFFLLLCGFTLLFIFVFFSCVFISIFFSWSCDFLWKWFWINNFLVFISSIVIIISFKASWINDLIILGSLNWSTCGTNIWCTQNN